MPVFCSFMRAFSTGYQSICIRAHGVKAKSGIGIPTPPAASLPIRHGLSITIVLCRTAQNRAIQASKQARSPPYLYRTTQYNGVFQTSCIQHLRDMGGGGGGRRREEKRKGEGGGGVVSVLTIVVLFLSFCNYTLTFYIWSRVCSAGA